MSAATTTRPRRRSQRPAVTLPGGIVLDASRFDDDEARGKVPTATRGYWTRARPASDRGSENDSDQQGLSPSNAVSILGPDRPPPPTPNPLQRDRP